MTGKEWRQVGYPREIYDGARAALSLRAREAKERQLFRKEEIRRVVPQIAQIEQELATTAAAVTRAVIAAPHNTQEHIMRLRDQNLELQRRRRALLKENGYPEDYLTDQYACSVCRDTGYIGSKMCDCLKELLKKEAYARLGEVSRYKVCRFDNFSLEYYPNIPEQDGVVPYKRMSQILEFCRRYADTFTQQSESVLMLGKTGLGKTHLSLAIAAAVTEKGYGVVYSPVQKLIDRLEMGKFSRDTESREQYSDHMEYVLGCDLLVLDDLGTEFYTQFSGSVLYNVINSRMAENRPTILNTNMELVQIEEKYSQRMVSRLVCGYKVLKFYGKDIRFIRKNQEK